MKISNTQSGKILVVDDYSYSRRTTAIFLSLQGYEIIEAESGADALARIHKEKPDLILLDVLMPGLDGFEVCRRLKQAEPTSLVPIVFITALEDRQARIKGIEAGGDDFLAKPFDRAELAARVKSLLRQKRLIDDLDRAEQMLIAIARTVEHRDPETGNHCERLAKLGEAFGRFLNRSSDEIKTLIWGGYLHDIGKIAIPDAILLKRDRLTPPEWDIMKQHPIVGENMCQPLRSMQSVLPIIRHHHERWNGSGYPDGLIGDEIPELVQIFQLLDIYDALTSERSYKRTLLPETALEILQAESRKGWRNPELVEQFVEFARSPHFPIVPPANLPTAPEARYTPHRTRLTGEKEW